MDTSRGRFTDEDLKRFEEHLRQLFGTEADEDAKDRVVLDSCSCISEQLIGEREEPKKQPRKTGFEGLFEGKSVMVSSPAPRAPKRSRLIHRKAMTRR